MSRVQDNRWHASGTHQVRVGDGAGVAVAMITLASLAVFLLGMPRLWIFLAGAAALGVGFAIFLACSNRSGGIAPVSLKGTHDTSDREAV